MTRTGLWGLLFGGSGDLVSKIMSTSIGVISSCKSSYVV